MNFIFYTKKYVNDLKYVIFSNILLCLIFYTMAGRAWIDILGLPTYLYLKELFLNFHPLVFNSLDFENLISFNALFEYEDINLQLHIDQINFIKDLNINLLDKSWSDNMLILKTFDFNKEYIKLSYLINAFEFSLIFVKYFVLWIHYSIWYPFVDFFHFYQKLWNDFAPELPVYIFKYEKLVKLSAKWFAIKIAIENLWIDIAEPICLYINLYKFISMLVKKQYFKNIFLFFIFLQIYWIWEPTAGRITNWIEVKTAFIHKFHWNRLYPHYNIFLQISKPTKWTLLSVNYGAVVVFWLTIGLLSLYIDYGIYLIYFVLYGTAFYFFYMSRSFLRFLLLFFQLCSLSIFYKPFKPFDRAHKLVKFVHFSFTSALAYIIFSYIMIIYKDVEVIEIKPLFTLLFTFLIIMFLISWVVMFFIKIEEFYLSRYTDFNDDECLYIFSQQVNYKTIRYYIRRCFEAYKKNALWNQYAYFNFVNSLKMPETHFAFAYRDIVTEIAKSHHFRKPLWYFFSLHAIPKIYCLLSKHLYKDDVLFEFFKNTTIKTKHLIFCKATAFTKYWRFFFKTINKNNSITHLFYPTNIKRPINKLINYKKTPNLPIQLSKINYYSKNFFNKPVILLFKNLTLRRKKTYRFEFLEWLSLKHWYVVTTIKIIITILKQRQIVMKQIRKQVAETQLVNFNYYYDLFVSSSWVVYNNCYFFLNEIPVKYRQNELFNLIYNKIKKYIAMHAQTTTISDKQYFFRFLFAWNEKYEYISHKRLNVYEKEEELARKFFRRLVFTKRVKNKLYKNYLIPFYFTELKSQYIKYPFAIEKFFSYFQSHHNSSIKTQTIVQKLLLKPNEHEHGEFEHSPFHRVDREFIHDLEYVYHDYKYWHWTSIPTYFYDVQNTKKLYLKKTLKTKHINLRNVLRYYKMQQNTTKNSYINQPKKLYIISTCNNFYQNNLSTFSNYVFLKKYTQVLTPRFVSKDWLQLKSFKILGAYQKFSVMLNLVPKLYKLQNSLKTHEFFKSQNITYSFFKMANKKAIYNYYNITKYNTLNLTHTILTIHLELTQQFHRNQKLHDMNKATVELHKENNEKLDPKLISPVDLVGLGAMGSEFYLYAYALRVGLRKGTILWLSYWAWNWYRDNKQLTPIVSDWHQNYLSPTFKVTKPSYTKKIKNKTVKKMLNEYAFFLNYRGK